MKRSALLMTVAALAFAAAGWAQENPAPVAGGGIVVIAEGVAPGGTVGAAGGVWVGGKSAAQWYIESIDKIVNLTDAQKKAITDIIEARDKAMQQFQTENAEKLKAASGAMMEAYKSKNKEAIEKASKAYQDLYAPMHEAMKKAQKELDDVLTAEQKATIFKHRAEMYVKSMFARAKLTEEQTAKIQAIIAEMAKQPDITVNWQAYSKLAEKINGLLTEEQKAAMKAPWTPSGAAPGASAVVAPGGIQVTISEAGEEAGKSAKARMGERIKHQRELVERAWKTYEALEALGEGKQAEARELWEKLETLQGELRQTFEQPRVQMLVPVQRLNVPGNCSAASSAACLRRM